MLEIVVEFGRYLAHQRQLGAGHRGKVVVFHMIADVEGEQIQDAIVGAGLRYEYLAVRSGDALHEVGRIELLFRYLLEQNVVLGHEVTGARMQAHHDHRAEQQVEHHAQAEAVVDQIVEGQLHDCVQQFPVVDRLRVHEERSENVEQRLQEDPEQLHERRSKDLALQVARYVGVQQFVALVAVMVQMVPGEVVEIDS